MTDDAANDAAMQAECVVRALDAYLAAHPQPPITTGSLVYNSCSNLPAARKLLVDTIAGFFRMKLKK